MMETNPSDWKTETKIVAQSLNSAWRSLPNIHIQNLFLLRTQVKTVSYKDKRSALEKMNAAAIPSAGQKCRKSLFCIYGIELWCLTEHMQNQMRCN